ncbi:hypothetical protein RCL1_002020 [Eukaryota sp. TZLM3-RCL]
MIFLALLELICLFTWLCVHSGIELYRARSKLLTSFSFTSAIRSRLFFYLFLFAAVVSRLSVLVHQAYITLASHHVLVSFEYNWIHVLPVLLFLSAFSVIIVFFARLYYSLISVHSNIITSFYFLLNLAAYLAFFLITGFTMNNQEDVAEMTTFKKTSFITFGVSFYISACSLFYYGRHIATSLSTAIYIRAGVDPRSFLRSRCLLLMSVIGIVFFARGTFFFIEAFLDYELRPKHVDRTLWEFFYFGISELLPALVCCYVLNSKAPKKPSDFSEFNSIDDDLLLN